MTIQSDFFWLNSKDLKRSYWFVHLFNLYATIIRLFLHKHVLSFFIKRRIRQHFHKTFVFSVHELFSKY